MHSHSYMPCTFIIGYKRKIYGWPHSVPFMLFLSMNVGLIICLTLLTTISGEDIPYKIPYNYYDIWMVVGQNSSGQLFFDTDLYSRRIFIWKPYNASIAPSLFFEEYPKIIQGDISTTPSGNLEGTVLEDIHVNPPPAFQKPEEKLSSKHRSGIHPTNAPTAAALKICPPGKNTSRNDTPVALGMNVLHHSLKLAELMTTLSQQRTIPNLMAPSSRNETLNSSSPSNDSIVYAKDEVLYRKCENRKNQMCETVYLISETFLLQNQMMTTNPVIRMTLTLHPCSHLGAVNQFLN